MTINSRRMRVNDVELNVVVQGEGPDVLLVHGFPDDHTVWRNQIPALVDAGYRVIARETAQRLGDHFLRNPADPALKRFLAQKHDPFARQLKTRAERVLGSSTV
jgi:pimeloyl-ACP methyl ester carboxylesterase